MPLIKCPDCNHDVSDQAQMCPKCSRPMSPVITTESSSKLSSSDVFWSGYFIALLIYGVKYGFVHAVTFGWFVALFNWLYVAFAIIQAVFT